MALTKWSPKNMEEFFETPFLPRLRSTFPIFKRFEDYGVKHPVVDMFDKDDEIVVKAEVPGVSKEDVNISLTDSTLTIKGETKEEKEVKEDDYYYSERSHGKFARMITLPEKVESNKVTAEFNDGVLEIHLPKAPEAKAKEIKVKVK